MRKSAEVIVIGLGGMGALAAYQLAARGATVLGFDQYGAAHDRGSSHGASRIIRQAYYEHPNYVPLLMRAYELWRNLEQESGDDGLLQIVGGLYLGSQDSDTVSGSLRSATEYKLPYEFLDAKGIVRKFPAFQPQENEVAVGEVNAGLVRPERALKASSQVATRHGADLHFNEPVLAWEVSGAGTVRVTTGSDVYEASRLIVAPGSWAPEMFYDLKFPLVVRRHVMAWFDPIGGVSPFLPERFPIYLWQARRDCIFYGFPAIDGPTGGVKVAMHTGGDICTPQSIDRAITPQDEQELRDAIAPRLPSLNGRLLTATTCMYTLTPDEHFVVGIHPAHPQVAIACGFSGHGFKFASVIGEILADLALTGETRHPIELLAPQRFL